MGNCAPPRLELSGSASSHEPQSDRTSRPRNQIQGNRDERLITKLKRLPVLPADLSTYPLSTSTERHLTNVGEYIDDATESLKSYVSQLLSRKKTPPAPERTT